MTTTHDLEQDIAETREHLGATVDALTDKFDVKSRAHDAVSEVDKRRLAAALAAVALAAVAVVLWRRG